MIALIKEDLLESDFSMCLGLLMSYQVPNDPLVVINKSQKIREAFLYAAPYESESIKLKETKEVISTYPLIGSVDSEETCAETNNQIKRASALTFDPLSQISCNTSKDPIK